MGFFEMCCALIAFLSAGGFWLGYVFLNNEAKYKLAKAKGGALESMATKEEVERLRQEVRSLQASLDDLRERSTEFDLSLQASIQHVLEARVGETNELRKISS